MWVFDTLPSWVIDLFLIASIASLIVCCICAGAFAAVGLWRWSGVFLLAGTVLVAPHLLETLPRGLIDTVLMASAYFITIGVVGAWLRRRRFKWAVALLALTLLFAVGPHLWGRVQVTRWDSRLLAEEMRFDMEGLRGARIALRGNADNCPTHLTAQFGLAAVHCADFWPVAGMPPWDLSEIEFSPPSNEPVDYLLISTHFNGFALVHPDLAGLGPDLVNRVEGEAYLFDATLWPSPDSLVARQVIGFQRLPPLGFPWQRGRAAPLAMEQTGWPMFCAVQRRFRRICGP